MATFVLEAIASLVFWVVIDHSRVRRWLPLIVSGIFMRFLYQFILINWLKLWIVNGGSWRPLWIPITADLTIWPLFTLLFLQFMPRPRDRLWYAGVFVLGTIGYEQLLVRLHILSAKPPWNIGFAFLEQSTYFATLYLLMQWLSPERERGGDA